MSGIGPFEDFGGRYYGRGDADQKTVLEKRPVVPTSPGYIPAGPDIRGRSPSAPSGDNQQAEWDAQTSRSQDRKEIRIPVKELTLDTAKKLITGDRAQTYGDAKENFERLSQMASAILNTHVSAAQMVLLLACLKIIRLSYTPSHADSWIDLAGYAALGSEVTEKANEQTSTRD